MRNRGLISNIAELFINKRKLNCIICILSPVEPVLSDLILSKTY